MFKQELIDQWLRMPRASRRSVREDPKATPAALENIDRLERHCSSHPYEVFCASRAPDPPFALYALESEEAAQRRLARPPAVFAAAVRADGCDGIGSRYAAADEVHATTAAANAHLGNVVARLAAFLEGAGATPVTTEPPPGSNDADMPPTSSLAAAHFFVRLVSEAAVAAACRQGVAARVESSEGAAHTMRHSRRRLQLHGTRTGAVAGAPGASAPGAGRAEGGGVDGLVTIRPIADHRRLSQGLVSLWGLIAPKPAPAKRDRCFAADDAALNPWTRARLEAARRIADDSGRTLPPPPLPAAAPPTPEAPHGAHAASPAPPPPGEGAWSRWQLPITELDVQFALRSLLAAPGGE